MPNKKILIVDDEPDMRLAIKNVLKIRGYDSLEAGDGKTALELLEKENPDLILLDIRLPGMDGVETLERIRNINKKVPVVMITGYGHIQSAVDIMKLGAQEYLQKPFENHQLIEVVKRFLDNQIDNKTTETTKSEEVKNLIEEIKVNEVFKKILIAIGGILILGALFFKFYIDKVSYKKVYPIVFKNVSALAISGEKIFIGDWIAQEIAEYELKNGSLNLITKYDLPNIHITAFAIANDRLYLSDSWRGVLEERALDEKLTVLKTYKNIGKIMSISFDGKNLWLKDDEDNVYVRNLDSELTLLRSYKISQSDEIFKDKKYLWAIVFKDGKVYRYKVDKDLKDEKVYLMAGMEKDISALTMKGDKVYYTISGEDKLFEVNKDYLKAVY